MEQDLLKAVLDSRPWLERFQRRKYRDAFLDYTEQFGPLYMAAAAQDGPERLAEQLLDGMAESWAGRRRWDRGTAKANTKQMMVCYLTPMLLGLEGEACTALAGLLQKGWETRWPGDGYGMATYAEISAGFRNTIMGFEIRS